MSHGDQVDAQEVGGEKPAAKKARPRKKAAANGPAASAGAKPATEARKRLPVATIGALSGARDRRVEPLRRRRRNVPGAGS